MMSDVRTKLKNGTPVTIGNNEYIIGGLLSDGGASCLVYNAERVPTVFEKRAGMPSIPAVIKEFYPLEMAKTQDIVRNGSHLEIATDKQSQFDELLQDFLRGAIKQVEFYGKGSIHSLAPSRLGDANNTAYTAVDSAVGSPLDKAVKEKQFLPEAISQVIASLAMAVKELHDKGLLHLDIKPSNIFLFENDGLLSHRVALFDFDSVISINDAQSGNGKIRFSEGWSAPEQGNRKRSPQYSKISKATDVFAIGAVLYWALVEELVDDAVIEKIEFQEFDFLDWITEKTDRRTMQEFFEVSLRMIPEDRAESTGVLLMDVLKPFVDKLATNPSVYAEQVKSSEKLNIVQEKVDNIAKSISNTSTNERKAEPTLNFGTINLGKNSQSEVKIVQTATIYGDVN
ncbi:MAG: protein kinase [Oscillospiraceae bacterium]|nr:protein kinase [Oscillospiraceae bacterium]